MRTHSIIPAACAVLAMNSVALDAQDSVPPPFPAPGKLVDIGGWRLHLDCTGERTATQPTVILEAGIGDFSVEWSLVQPKVAAFARVCSYDRAGDGWSDVGPHPRTLRQISYELHTLLQNAGERAPFVLVGHSFGGWIVRAYAAQYPTEVAGLVLVEGGWDNPLRIIPGRGTVRSADLATGAPIPPIKTSGPLRLSDLQGRVRDQILAAVELTRQNPNEPPRDKLPGDAQRARAWALGRVGHIVAGVNPLLEEELALLRTAREQNPNLYGDMPLVVITRGIPDESGPAGLAERKKEHATLAALSHNGKQIVAERSGHHVQIEQPELVTDAIREVVRALTRRWRGVLV
jgi:pimeloyl-ACP methyl ester carboxylesterase